MKAFRKRSRKNGKRIKSFGRLLVIGILILLLTVWIFKIVYKTEEEHTAENARLQYSLVLEGYHKDVENIRQKDRAKLLSGLLIQELGKPYAYGQEGPNSFDCSGLVKYVYSKLDIHLPRIASDQACFGAGIEESGMRYGDLIFFSWDGIKISHTGIYLYDGYFEHAPRSGEVVRISSLNSEYYRSAFKKAVRILD